DDSYSDALSKILQSARGPLTDIEDFETPDNIKISISNSLDEAEEARTEEIEGDRTHLRRLAAVMAVLSMQAVVASESQSDIGRQLGSAWAQDHRLSAMGLPGLAYSRAKRSTWR
ncbi:MAG: hypothetical protein NZ774_06685, partial [Candidatus Poseidoniales archaeon]|nr:hypothetical protein [Candidatus Poseidoniales archaeon]